MSTQKYYGEERASTFFRLLLLIKKLQKCFSLLAVGKEGEEELEVSTTVPGDVMEGHFAVLAMKGAKKKRFVVKLKYLTGPAFLRLLEQAEEEYGFEQTGTSSAGITDGGISVRAPNVQNLRVFSFIYNKCEP